MHPLPGSVIKNPDDIPDSVVVVGYLGKSSKDGFHRIYLDADLRSYYEIQHDQLLHAEKADPSDEQKPTRIYIKATGKLVLVQILEASFLKGPIASAYAWGTASPCCCPPPTCCHGMPPVGCPHPGGGGTGSGTFACPTPGCTHPGGGGTGSGTFACPPPVSCTHPGGGGSSSGTFFSPATCGGQHTTWRCLHGGHGSGTWIR